MSTLAAVQGDGWCVIGADSQLTEGSRIYSATESSGKLIKTTHFIIGVVGELFPLQRLAHVYFGDPLLYVGGVQMWIHKHLIPLLRELYVEYDIPLVPKDKKDGATYLLAVNGEIYCIGDDFTWTQDRRGLYGIGSGGDFALGCLDSNIIPGVGPDWAKRVMDVAINTASKFDINTSAPAVVHTQYSRTYSAAPYKEETC